MKSLVSRVGAVGSTAKESAKAGSYAAGSVAMAVATVTAAGGVAAAAAAVDDTVRERQLTLSDLPLNRRGNVNVLRCPGACLHLITPSYDATSASASGLVACESEYLAYVEASPGHYRPILCSGDGSDGKGLRYRDVSRRFTLEELGGGEGATVNNTQDQPPRLMAGWLYKKARSKGSWSKRYMVIRGGLLFYYKDDRCEFCQGVVPLDRQEVITPSAGANTFDIHSNKLAKHGYEFRLVSPHQRDFRLTASSNEERWEWVSCLKEWVQSVSASRKAATCNQHRAAQAQEAEAEAGRPHAFRQEWHQCNPDFKGWMTVKRGRRVRGGVTVWSRRSVTGGRLKWVVLDRADETYIVDPARAALRCHDLKVKADKRGDSGRIVISGGGIDRWRPAGRRRGASVEDEADGEAETETEADGNYAAEGGLTWFLNVAEIDSIERCNGDKSLRIWHGAQVWVMTPQPDNRGRLRDWWGDRLSAARREARRALQEAGLRAVDTPSAWRMSPKSAERPEIGDERGSHDATLTEETLAARFRSRGRRRSSQAFCGDGWMSLLDSSSGHTYYYNQDTKETTWTNPYQQLGNVDVGDDGDASRRRSSRLSDDNGENERLKEERDRLTDSWDDFSVGSKQQEEDEDEVGEEEEEEEEEEEDAHVVTEMDFVRPLAGRDSNDHGDIFSNDAASAAIRALFMKRRRSLNVHEIEKRQKEQSNAGGAVAQERPAAKPPHKQHKTWRDILGKLKTKSAPRSTPPPLSASRTRPSPSQPALGPSGWSRLRASPNTDGLRARPNTDGPRRVLDGNLKRPHALSPRAPVSILRASPHTGGVSPLAAKGSSTSVQAQHAPSLSRNPNQTSELLLQRQRFMLLAQRQLSATAAVSAGLTTAPVGSQPSPAAAAVDSNQSNGDLRAHTDGNGDGGNARYTSSAAGEKDADAPFDAQSAWKRGLGKVETANTFKRVGTGDRLVLRRPSRNPRHLDYEAEFGDGPLGFILHECLVAEGERPFHGGLVTEVLESCAAKEKGVLVNDVLIGVNGERGTYDQLLAAVIQSSRPVMLKFQRAGGTCLSSMMQQALQEESRLQKAGRSNRRKSSFFAFDVPAITPAQKAVAQVAKQTLLQMPGQKETDLFGNPVDFRRVLLDFLQEHNPQQVGEIDKLLTTMRGGEWRAFEALSKRYATVNPLYVPLLEGFLSKHDPKSARNAKTMLEQHAGREEHLFRVISQTYKDVNPLDAARDQTHAARSSGTGDGNGNGNGNGNGMESRNGADALFTLPVITETPDEDDALSISTHGGGPELSFDSEDTKFDGGELFDAASLRLEILLKVMAENPLQALSPSRRQAPEQDGGDAGSLHISGSLGGAVLGQWPVSHLSCYRNLNQDDPSPRQQPAVLRPPSPPKHLPRGRRWQQEQEQGSPGGGSVVARLFGAADAPSALAGGADTPFVETNVTFQQQPEYKPQLDTMTVSLSHVILVEQRTGRAKDSFAIKDLAIVSVDRRPTGLIRLTLKSGQTRIFQALDSAMARSISTTILFAAQTMAQSMSSLRQDSRLQDSVAQCSKAINCASGGAVNDTF